MFAGNFYRPSANNGSWQNRAAFNNSANSGVARSLSSKGSFSKAEYEQ
jgi:hypothetical protein